jgi:hypothetical protein
MKYFLVPLVIAASLLVRAQTLQPATGDIKGSVTDSNGNLVRGVTVYALPQDPAFDSITPRSIVTDSRGEFDFHGGFHLGTYKLYSRKDADAYPDRSDNFYADPKLEPQKADLSENHPVATVTLSLGEKAAVFVGRVIDAATGAILQAKLVFLDEDGNDHSVMTNGKFRTLLPAGKPVSFLVMVLSPGYGSQTPPGPLLLAPGQELQMDTPISKQ